MNALVQNSLTQIEQQLRQCGRWQTTPPSAEALASTAPFCCDSMPFEQWLQFVLLPRMQALLDSGAALPTAVAIAPMAEYVFGANPDCQTLIAHLAEFDRLLSGSEPRGN
ncbi:YqcC family protein [Ferrimonas senticii]|uniref:YqcC family protein n=1 Tax=Ferrimonas senticii TaxID=394566 RepID=UPI0003F76470|nr:YqcC family protein [Ferrimonas senticii]